MAWENTILSFLKKTWHHTKYVIYNLHMSGVDFQKEMFLNVNI